MLHPWYIGHFDPTAVAMFKLVVRRPLDMASIRSELERRADKVQEGAFFIGPDRFSIHSEFLRCWDFVRSSKAVDFMVEIAELTDSQIAFPETGQVFDPQGFRKWHYNSEAKIRRQESAREERLRNKNNSTAD